MSRAKTFTAAAFGALALSGFAATLASAATPGWMINGGMLNGTASLAKTAAVDERFDLKAVGITTACLGNTVNAVNPTINSGTNMADAASLEFTECEVTVSGNPPCKLAAAMSKTIKTLPVLVDLTLDGTLADKGRFLSTNASKLFATIEYEGGECAIASAVQAVHGSVTFLAPTGQDERALQQITITNEEPGSLLFSKNVATLEGSVLVRLPNGEPFSFL